MNARPKIRPKIRVEALSLRRIWAILCKELLVLFYNRTSRLMLIVPPLAQIVIFGWAATMEVRNVTFAVFNRDNGVWSTRVCQTISGSPTFVRMIEVPSDEEVQDCMDRGRTLFCLVFDERFSRDLEAGREARLQVLLDGRRANASQLAVYYLTTIIQTFTAAQANPLSVAVRSWFNPNLDFQWFFLPNLIGMLTYMLGLVVTGLSVAREREVGTFDQLLVTPSTSTEIALAKLMPGCITGCVHGTIFLVITVFGFGVPFTGSVLLLYLSLLVFALASGGMGLMVSSLCATQQQAFLGAFTIGVPSILISGVVTPVNNMPIFLQYVSELVPLRHFAVLCQGVFLKDISPAAAALQLGKIGLICLVSVSVAVWMFRRRT